MSLAAVKWQFNISYNWNLTTNKKAQFTKLKKKSCKQQLQAQTFPSKDSATARAFFERGPWKVFACIIYRCQIISRIVEHLTMLKNENFGQKSISHTRPVLSPGLSKTRSEFWELSTSSPLFNLLYMSCEGSIIVSQSSSQ